MFSKTRRIVHNNTIEYIRWLSFLHELDKNAIITGLKSKMYEASFLIVVYRGIFYSILYILSEAKSAFLAEVPINYQR